MALPILFLPGIDGTPHSARKVAEHLPRELVPFEYPDGQALSWPGLVEDVARSLEKLGTGLVAGESFGGALALKAAILQPEAVNGLCLLGAFTRRPEPFASMLARTATRVLPKALMRPVARRLADWKLAGNLEGEARTKFLERFNELNYAAFARRLKLLASYDIRGELGRIDVPVEVIYGSEDTIAKAKEQASMWSDLPDANLHPLEGAGHVICAERPAEVAHHMEAWAQKAEAVRG